MNQQPLGSEPTVEEYLTQGCELSNMYDRLLISVDGSTGAARAVESGLSLARAIGATVDLLFVVDTEIESMLDETEGRTLMERSEKAGRRATAEIQEQETKLNVERTIRHGRPYEEILTHAEEQRADLCVLGAGGTGGQALGSTAERVATLSPVPVVVVPEADGSTAFSPGTIEDIVVAVDGSDPADRAAQQALEIAERFGATLHVVYVVDSTVYDLEDAPRSIVGLLRTGGETIVEEITGDAHAVNVPATGNVLRGNPSDEIREYAGGVGADLLAVGTRGIGGVSDRFLGSTTERMIRDAGRPVLTVQ